MSFPLAGIDRSMGFARQPNRPVQGGGYARTTPEGSNVRSFEPTSSRARGGRRPGLAKYADGQVSGTNLIQHLGQIVGTGYTPPGGGVQSSASGRVVTLVGISDGDVKVLDAGAALWVAVTGGTNAFATSGIVRSTTLNQVMYFADGSNSWKYSPADNTLSLWSATAGSIPIDSSGNTARHICTYRGRVVVSGLVKNPNAVFASAVGDATNWDYGAVVNAGMAFAFSAERLGLIGDVVTGLVPLSDDLLLIGGDHTLTLLRGDPMAGGQLDNLSDAIGMAWGQAWCRDPLGTTFFLSNRGSVYAMEPGGMPVRISQPVEQLLNQINTGTHTVSMGYDDQDQVLHVFITATAGAAANTHYVFEQRAGSWWQLAFANNNHNPLVCCTFDGNLATDRKLLIGSWDGYVRYFSSAASNDDGTAIASSVTIGPLTTKDLDELLLKEIQAELGTASGSVSYAVHVGDTAEAALASTAVRTGTFAAGRSNNQPIRLSGHNIYLKLSSTAAWAMERIRALIQTTGKVRRRG